MLSGTMSFTCTFTIVCNWQLCMDHILYICTSMFLPTAYFQLENGILPLQKISGELFCLSAVCSNNSYADWATLEKFSAWLQIAIQKFRISSMQIWAWRQEEDWLFNCSCHKNLSWCITGAFLLTATFPKRLWQLRFLSTIQASETWKLRIFSCCL